MLTFPAFEYQYKMKLASILGCLLAVAAVTSCDNAPDSEAQTSDTAHAQVIDLDEERAQINSFLDQWHDDAANARPAYFDKMAEGSIYIGTDKTELWQKQDFQEWAQKYFAEGKGWDFDRINRNIYFSEGGEVAWFDELLGTWMGDCRGSGVLSRQDSTWKIEHYHLGVTVPNDTLNGFIEMVKAFEEKQQSTSGKAS